MEKLTPKTIGVNKKDFWLLLEAFRRKHLLIKQEKNEKFFGLGTPSSYKSKMFKPSFGEKPKVNNWYMLTDLGNEKLQLIEGILLPLPTDKKELENLNLAMFTGNFF